MIWGVYCVYVVGRSVPVLNPAGFAGRVKHEWAWLSKLRNKKRPAVGASNHFYIIKKKHSLVSI